MTDQYETQIRNLQQGIKELQNLVQTQKTLIDCLNQRVDGLEKKNENLKHVESKSTCLNKTTYTDNNPIDLIDLFDD